MKKVLAMMGLLLMLMVSAVSAGTILAPANGEEICGTYTFSYNVTTSDTTNVTLWRSTLSNGTLPWVNVASSGNTTANQTAFTIAYNTAGVTDGVAYSWNLTASGSATFSSDYVNSSNVDNTGAVLTFGATNTKDKDIVTSDDFSIVFTSDENLASAPVVNFKGQYFTMSGSGVSWSYDFGVGSLRDDSYKYSISGTDNTTCGNVGSVVTREVTIYSKASAAAKVNVAEEQAQQQTAKNNKNLILVAIAIGAYVIFFHKKGGRKK